MKDHYKKLLSEAIAKKHQRILATASKTSKDVEQTFGSTSLDDLFDKGHIKFNDHLKLIANSNSNALNKHIGLLDAVDKLYKQQDVRHNKIADKLKQSNPSLYRSYIEPSISFLNFSSGKISKEKIHKNIGWLHSETLASLYHPD